MSELCLSESRHREERASYCELSLSETAETACTLLEGRFRCMVKKCGRNGREQEEVQPTARADDARRHLLQDSPHDARRCVCLCFLLPWHVFECDEFFYRLSPRRPSSCAHESLHTERHGERQCHCCCQHAHFGGGRSKHRNRW